MNNTAFHKSISVIQSIISWSLLVNSSSVLLYGFKIRFIVTLSGFFCLYTNKLLILTRQLLRMTEWMQYTRIKAKILQQLCWVLAGSHPDTHLFLPTPQMPFLSKKKCWMLYLLFEYRTPPFWITYPCGYKPGLCLSYNRTLYPCAFFTPTPQMLGFYSFVFFFCWRTHTTTCQLYWYYALFISR